MSMSGIDLRPGLRKRSKRSPRSEEHTSELQSRQYLHSFPTRRSSDLGHVVDHALAALDSEVDVDVGHRLAAGIEEALEEEPVPDRVEVGDPEAVGGDRAGGRAAAGADADAVPLREADEVLDDEEVVGEAHLADRLQLEAQAVLELGRDLVVPPLEPFLAELDEVLERVPVVRRRERREQDPAELDLDVAALRDLERA